MAHSFFRTLLVPAFLVLSAYAQIGVVPQRGVTLKDATDDKFQVGDVWEYKTRKGEERSRITIVKIDQSSTLGIIVHIGVDHLRVLNNDGEVQFEAIPHMPFLKKALEESVTKKLASRQPLPDFQPGYAEFREEFLKGQAGAYSISVADAVRAMEFTFQKGTASQQ